MVRKNFVNLSILTVFWLLFLSCGGPNEEAGQQQAISETKFARYKTENAEHSSEENFFQSWMSAYRDLSPVWWFEMIRVPEVFDSLGSRNLNSVPDQELESAAPVIAILDSGLDYEHPSLAGRVWVNPAPGMAGCDNDQWGCDTTAAGGEFGKGPAWPFGTNGPGQICRENHEGGKIGDTACSHGTHIAGLLVGSLPDGVPGVCPYCKIFPVRVIQGVDGEGKVPDDAILKALRYIKRINEQHNGIIRVVNSSFGKFERSLLVQEAVRDLSESGVLVVAAAGNEGAQDEVFPAAFEEALSVTAVGATGQKSWYSNFGPWADIAAPGGNKSMEQIPLVELGQETVASLLPGSGLGLSQGTSVAAPMVAGVAGLLWMLFPELSVGEVRERILRSADRKLYRIDYASGFNTPYLQYPGGEGAVALLGAGLLDAKAAFDGADYGQHEGKGFERVEPGCGVLGSRSPKNFPYHIFLLMFLLPLLISFLSVRRGV